MQYSGDEPYKIHRKRLFATEGSTFNETVYPKTEDLFENFITLPEVEFLRDKGFYCDSYRTGTKESP